MLSSSMSSARRRGGRSAEARVLPSKLHDYLNPLSESKCYYKVYGTLPSGVAVCEINPDALVGKVLPIEITSVDMLIQENATSHFTDKYEITQQHLDELSLLTMQADMVVRRGQEFKLRITTDRALTAQLDEIRLVFEIGPKPMVSKGTAVMVKLSDKNAEGQWHVKVGKAEDKELTLCVRSPASVAIGKWTLHIESSVPNKTNTDVVISRRLLSNTVTILCNPWCKDDDVFLDNEDQRQEYVLNDTGKLYIGNTRQIGSRPWSFAQFDDIVLKCVLWLLDNKSQLNHQQHGDVVRLTRDISTFVNSNDENGLLEGRWDGSYDDGVAPTSWISSAAILRQFMEKRQPVKYGQCWVFSAVTTTICRCLGIPVRSVTNFSSAHDTDGSMTIDVHYNKTGAPLDKMNIDSIWNFHVWNDVWMARRDLPAGYGGWQAIDATPQETSSGVFCAGPASLAAVKQGLVTYPYDTGFVFAEVNADRINWIKNDDGTYRKIVEPDVVGWNISTKSCSKKMRVDYGNDREDITMAYKYAEGTWEERAAVLRASQNSTKPQAYDKVADDVTFTAENKEFVSIGSPFEVPVKVKNNSTGMRNVSITVTCSSVYYTGVPYRLIKTVRHSGTLAAAEEKVYSMTVEWQEYSQLIADQYNIKVHILASVRETKQVFLNNDDFRLQRPILNLQAPATVKAGEAFILQVSFTNPLPCPLTKCVYYIDGNCLLQPAELPISGVGALRESKVELKLQSKVNAIGRLTLMASFDSVELRGSTGDTQVLFVSANMNSTRAANGASRDTEATSGTAAATGSANVAMDVSASPGGGAGDGRDTTTELSEGRRLRLRSSTAGTRRRR